MHFYWPNLRRILEVTFSRERFRLRHGLFAIALLAAIGLLAATNALFRAIDRLLYADFEDTEIEAPIFILANPRSGTTYLHRLLALDPRFNTMRLWQTLAPNICAYRLVEKFESADRALGRPIGRLADAFDRHLLGGWEGIHDTGLSRTEEDEMLWVYPFLTASVLIFFPFPDRLAKILRADLLPEAGQKWAAEAYRSHLKRHLYATRMAGREGSVFLGKNALAASRIRTMRRALPDMRVVHLVRHPYEAVSSTISMFSKVWNIHSPHLLGDTDESRGWAEVAYDSYRTLHGLQGELAEDHFVELRYDELIADPEATIERIYEVFGLEMTDAYRARLREEVAHTRDWESGHEHSLEDYGLSEKSVYAEIKDVFEAYDFEP